MGSKSAAKALMQAAQVPLTPGYHGDNQNPSFLAGEAERIGYPVLIKASAGGGGKGMRRVDKPEDFEAALVSCKREPGTGPRRHGASLRLRRRSTAGSSTRCWRGS